MPPQKTYSEVVLPIVRATREITLPYWGKVGNFHHKDNDDVTTSVTDLDLKVEKFLTDKLKAEYPTIGFVGEEFGGERNQKSFWLCDPIDGTEHFIRGTPFCTTMIALVDKGEVVFSAIYNFVTDEMYSAEKGLGAKLNGEPIHVSERTLSKSYLAWETHLDKEENLKKFLALRKYGLFKAMVSGYEYSLVASGGLDGRIAFDPWGGDYDFAPGAFLVAEAGGIVRNIGKNSYNYRDLNFIAANPMVYRDLTEGPDAIFPVMN